MREVSARDSKPDANSSGHRLEDEDGTTPIGSTRHRREAEEWLVVLAAAGISAHSVRIGAAWHVVVPARAARAARAHVREFRSENLSRSHLHRAAVDFGPSPVGLGGACVLLLLHAASFLEPGRTYWIAHGRASAAMILEGEVWRALTALTLHADLAHVAGNAAGWFVFAGALARNFGFGVGVLAVLGAGVFGNLLNAAYHGASHASIGASTAIFGAVGILAGAQLARRRLAGPAGSRSWLPFGAALAILAMVGMNPESDVFAHAFGLGAGFVMGWWLFRSRLYLFGRGAQWSALVAAAALAAGAWAAALLR